MKKAFKLMVDYDEELEDTIDSLSDVEMDRVWLDTGDAVIELPSELLPYLEEADILGIA